MSKSQVDQRKAELQQQLAKAQAKIGEVQSDLDRIERVYRSIKDRFKSQGDDEVKALAQQIERLDADLRKAREVQTEREKDLERRIREKEQAIKKLEEDLGPIGARFQTRAADYKSSITDSNQVLRNAIDVVDSLREKLQEGVNAVGARALSS